jgi:hypothetical protein
MKLILKKLTLRKIYFTNNIVYKNFNIIYGTSQNDITKSKKERNFKIITQKLKRNINNKFKIK